MLKRWTLLGGVTLVLALMLSNFVHAQSLGRSVNLTSVQKVSYTGTSAATSSTIGGSGTVAALVLCSTDCHLTAAASPTATTSNMLLPAMTLIWVWVDGGSDKLAFIQANASGTAYVVEQ